MTAVQAGPGTDLQPVGAGRNAAFVAKYWPQPTTRATTVAVGAPPGGAPAYVQAAYRNELQAVAMAEEGVRNDTLNRAAFNLATLCASGHLPWDQVEADLHAVGIGVGLTEREVRGTLHSAFGAGSRHPRTVPEPTFIDAPEVTVIGTLDGQPHDAVLVGTGLDAAADADAITEAFPRLDWQALWDDDTKDEWIVEPLLPARRLVALFSPPKVGKSLLLLEMAVAIARGVTVLGATPPRPYRVLYVDFENDPRGDVRTRLQAMGMTPGDLDNLVYLSYPRLPYLDTPAGGQALLAVIDAYGCEVVVIDTISRSVAGEENENDTWLKWYRSTGVALKARGIACIRLDHTGKDPTKGMRGGSAKYGDVDVVWSMVESGVDRLHLECTANRLLVPEKNLHLVRRMAGDGGPLRHEIDMRTPGQMHHDVIEELAKALDRMAWPKLPEGAKQRPKGAGEGPARDALVASGWEPKGDNGATVWHVRQALDRREESTWIPVLPEQGALKFGLEVFGLEVGLEVEDPE